jgi:hypothetical protein
MKIQGFVTEQATAESISAAVEAACDTRGVARFIAMHGRLIHSGQYAGQVFLPLADSDLQQVMYRGQCLPDFPEFAQLVAILGGLDARVEIEPSDIFDPDPSLDPDFIDPNDSLDP